MGTALTKEQARLVKRYSPNVMISYDGDFAGQKNTLRGLEILKEEGINVRVVPLPEGLDPDDVVKQGNGAYQKCLDEALPLIDYKILFLERKYDLSRTDEKRKFVSEALKIVATAESESIKEELLVKLREKTGISYQALERDMQNVPKEKEETPQVAVEEKIAEAKEDASVSDKAARFVLAAKLFSMQYAKEFDISSVEFTNEVHKVIVEYIKERESAGERIRPSELFEILEEDCPEFNEILDLNYGEKLSGEIGQRFFEDSVETLLAQDSERKIERLNAAYAVETDTEKRKALAKEIALLIARKKVRKGTKKE
jgi:DNA primase